MIQFLFGRGSAVFRNLAHQLAALAGDRRGNIAALFALLLVPLVGILSLAFETSSWFLYRHAMQSTADSAVVAAGANADAANGGTTYITEAKAVAASSGFTDGVSNTAVTPNYWTTTSKCPASLTTCYQVTISRYVPLYLVGLLGYTGTSGNASQEIQATAYASPGQGGNVCVLALDTRSNDIHSIFGGTNADATIGGSCQVADNLLNKNATDSVDVKSGAKLIFDSLYMTDATKCDSGTCDGTLTVTQPIQYSKAAVTDPYAGRTIPAATGSCDHTNLVVSTSQTLSQGTYCGTTNHAALTISGSGTKVTLSPGVYILDGQGGGTGPGGCTGTTKPSACVSGNFVNTTGAKVTGSGVTIVLTTSKGVGIDVGNMYIENSSSLSLTAPASDVGSDQVAGIAIWQNKIAPNPTVTDGNMYSSTTAGVNTVSSGASTDIVGLVYFPSQGLFYSGGSGGSACTQIVAFSIVFVNSSQFNYPSDCPIATGEQSIGSNVAFAKLVQ
jgi:Flp pilus assembly protein TadG